MSSAAAVAAVARALLALLLCDKTAVNVSAYASTNCYMYVSSAAALARALLALPLCDGEAALATVEGHPLPLFVLKKNAHVLICPTIIE